MSNYQSTQKSNITRCFGYTPNSASAKLLKLVKENPDTWYSIKEAAALTFCEYSPIDNAIFNGRNVGVIQVRKREKRSETGRRVIECAFLADPVPYIKPPKPGSKKPGRKPGLTRAASPVKTNDRKTREKLETRQRMNFANPIKAPGDNTPVPHSLATHGVTVRENYPPHRYWVDPAKVPVFRYGSSV